MHLQNSLFAFIFAFNNDEAAHRRQERDNPNRKTHITMVQKLVTVQIIAVSMFLKRDTYFALKL